MTLLPTPVHSPSLLGARVAGMAALYVAAGLLVAIAGGMVVGRLHLERCVELLTAAAQ